MEKARTRPVVIFVSLMIGISFFLLPLDNVGAIWTGFNANSSYPRTIGNIVEKDADEKQKDWHLHVPHAKYMDRWGNPKNGLRPETREMSGCTYIESEVHRHKTLKEDSTKTVWVKDIKDPECFPGAESVHIRSLIWTTDSSLASSDNDIEYLSDESIKSLDNYFAKDYYYYIIPKSEGTEPPDSDSSNGSGTNSNGRSGVSQEASAYSKKIQCDWHGEGSTMTRECQFKKHLRFFLKTVIFITVPIITIMFIIGGIRWSLAGGNAQSVSGAKSQILNAFLALVAFVFLWSFMEWLLPGGAWQNLMG